MDGHTFSPFVLSQKKKQKFAKPMSHVDTTLHNTVCCCWEETLLLLLLGVYIQDTEDMAAKRVRLRNKGMEIEREEKK